MRRLAVCHDYNELLNAIRARRDALGITYATVDHVAGLTHGYASHLLGPPRVMKTGQRQSNRHFGHASLGAVLGTLGLKLLVVEDPEALAKVRGRLVKRKHAKNTMMLTDQPRQRPRFLPFLDTAFASAARARGLALQSPEQRSRIARRAARARWRQPAA